MTRTSDRFRAALLASAAGVCLVAIPGAANAQSAGFLSRSEVVREAQGGGGHVDISNAIRESQGSTVNQADVLRESQRVGGGADIAVAPQPEIVIANPPPAPGQPANTTVTDRDPVNITGVGQMIVDTQDGFIGLCTGTLINPRTVIFAAHCVNEEAATLYGASSGGRPIAFGFQNSNNTAGNSAFGHYLATNQTNVADYLYNVNQVRYNPLSTSTNSGGPGGFLIGDIAVASFDTPTKNIPTWALLFSALPAAGGGAAGTGYHVTIEGYGNNGTASTGSTGGIDYRRRLAENMIGGLASLGDFEQFLFGPTGTSDATNPQNLYWIDFDDPRRGTAGASIYDFNAWRDNAVPGKNGKLSQEGITASGDSGGPLILDNTFAKQVVIATLSGGYTRFFTGQPANGYGTASFYQPLYLYWDWIAANNPYHYVSAKAGDGAWTDASHWVTNVDPNYQIIGPNGQLVTGVPDSPGLGNTNQPGWGQVCFQSGNSSDCLDVATGIETYDPTGHPIGTDADTPGTLGNDRGTVATGSIDGVQSDGGATKQAIASEEDSDQSANGTQSADGDQSANALPAATLANGLPGATNFVPNNVDPVRTTGAIGKYFDVTLTATGTTTLNTAVTVDRFAIGIGGGGAVLDIQTGGSLTSLIDITQATGAINVNGTLTTPGDYMMISGGLSGSGTINTPYFTSVAGTIAPGTATGGIGTLTFNGNVILSSASTSMFDLGANGVSDQIAVRGSVTSGIANLGGRLVVNVNSAARAGNLYTIVTAQNMRTGTFTNAPTSGSMLAPISGILTPKVIYNPANVQVQLVAGLYRDLFVTGSQEYQYAQLLDQNRPLASKYDSVYGPLDLASAAAIRTTLNSLLPATETTVQSLGIAGVENMGSFIRNRAANMDTQSLGGEVAHYGAPIQVASLGNSGGAFGSPTIRSDAQPDYVEPAKLPETMSAFVAGGYLNGDSAPMIGSGAIKRDDFDGWYAAAGIEANLGGDGALGLALSYTDLDGTSGKVGQNAKGKIWQGTLYGKVNLGGVTLDGQFGAGIFQASTTRAINFLGTPYVLRSRDNAMVLESEIGLGKDFGSGGVKITPRAAFRATQIGYTPTVETGGPGALAYNRGNIKSVQARGGVTVAGTGASFKPWVNGTWVHDFEGRPGFIGANFAGGIVGNSAFTTNVADKNYGEVSGGITFKTGTIDLGVSAETTVMRKDVSAQSYRGSITFHF